MSPIRLAIVTGAFPVASQAFITRKVCALAARGFDVTVIALAPRDSPFPPTPRVAVRYLYGQRRSYLGATARAIHAAFRDPVLFLRAAKAMFQKSGGLKELRQLPKTLLFAGLNVDVVHVEWALKALEIEEALKLLPAATVVSCRGSEVRVIGPANPVVGRRLTKLFEEVDVVHCVSDDVRSAAMALGLAPDKAIVNRPAVDTNLFQSVRTATSDPVVKLISVGRIHWVKGHDYAIAALKKLLDRGLPVRLDIVGPADPQGMASLTLAINDFGVHEAVRVRCTDHSARDVARLLSEADIYVSASLSEGISNAVLEAMAVGLPVVTTDVGGMKEAVRDGIEGYLVPARNVDRLADAIAKLISDVDLRQRMGASGRARIAEQFCLERQIDVFAELYTRLADKALQPALGPSRAEQQL